jgi:sec-independent protein translocase protein TatA
MFGLGATELIIILIIVLIIFGVGRLPQIGEGMGKAIKGFKKASSDDDVIDVTPEKSKKKRTKDIATKGKKSKKKR